MSDIGARGRIPGSPHSGGRQPDPERKAKLHGGKRPSSSAAIVSINNGRPEIAPLEATPDPPEHFTDVQIEMWHGLIASYPEAVLAGLDFFNLVRIVELFSERATYQRLVVASPLMRVPVRDRHGTEIGSKAIPNPAEAMLRRVDRTINEVATTMGLSVESRTRLSWTVSQARLANAEVERLLGPDFLKENTQ